MATFPITYPEIQAKLDEIETAMTLYRTEPAKFAAMMSGAVNLSIPDYLGQLREERLFYYEMLKTVPYWNQSEMENAL